MRILTALAILALPVLSLYAADVTGKWQAEMKTPDGQTRATTFTFKVDGAALTGTVASPRGENEISEGKVDGDTISFVVVRNFGGQEMKMQYTGKVSGDEIRLQMQFPGGNRPPMELVAKKV